MQVGLFKGRDPAALSGRDVRSLNDGHFSIPFNGIKKKNTT